MKSCLSQTHDFLTRRTARLDLYVDAQGVNLRSLEQQIARQLDIYNGVLRYPEVVPLARLGVLGLVIDGFDELISPGSTTLLAPNRNLADFDAQGADRSTRRSFMRALGASDFAHETPVSVATLEVRPWSEDSGVHTQNQRAANISSRRRRQCGVRRSMLGPRRPSWRRLRPRRGQSPGAPGVIENDSSWANAPKPLTLRPTAAWHRRATCHLDAGTVRGVAASGGRRDVAVTADNA